MVIQLIVPDIRLPLEAPTEYAFDIAKKRLKSFINVKNADCKIYRKSIDARKKEMTFVYSVLVHVTAEFSPDIVEKLRKEKITVSPVTKIEIRPGREKADGRIAVIGFGPAGMFASMLLAENGYRPIVLERGGDVSARTASVSRFFRDKILDTESNVQFGAGGAGTFSDGKLMTRINDSKCALVLQKFVELGAPEEILYQAKPHVGTDHLKPMVENMIAYIKRCGGEFHFNTRVDDIQSRNSGVALSLSDGSRLLCGAAVLAIGHSARDTYEMLINRGFALIPKPFSVGVRIEHLQSEIDEALYGRKNILKYQGSGLLPKGEYTLSLRENGRAVYSFCMCPGGEVVAAASEAGGVCVNGMSNYRREGKNANCALAVSVSAEDIDGNSPRDFIAFQRMLERRAFLCGGENYSVPLQTVGDFLSDRTGSAPSKIQPTYMNGTAYNLCNLNTVLPDFVCDMLKRGIRFFDSRISGFSVEYALLSGVETRTSAPVRILRGENRSSLGNQRVYPCGEGAGYAGGIMSAAVDGLSTAAEIIARFAPPDI